MFQRIYPGLVSLLGSIGLGLALTYFVGVGLVFVEGLEDWALFFTDHAILLILPPYLSLVAHLVLRNHVGRYLLNRGAYQDALDYGRSRSKASPLRGRREAANQTLVWARGLIALGDYDEACSLLEERLDSLPSKYALEAQRWLLEIALREDDRDRARELTEDPPKPSSPTRTHAALFGAQAELALRDSDLTLYQERMLAAMTASAAHPRVGLSRVLSMIHHDESGDQDDEILTTLDLLHDSIAIELPTRSAEFDALKAWILAGADRHDEAQSLLESAREKPTDPWTDEVLQRTQSRLTEVGGRRSEG